jgi:hypothetical protein
VGRIKFKLWPKIHALELLGKHHKLYVEVHEHDWRAGLAERLAAALARVDGEGAQQEARASPQDASKSRRSTDRRRQKIAVRNIARLK